MWVINNGVAHGDSIRGSDIMPWVDEALDSLEFITGAPDTKWGSVRAAMGHPEPWSINYMAIGNEVRLAREAWWSEGMCALIPWALQAAAEPVPGPLPWPFSETRPKS